jgi:hypothetical protein
VIKQRYAQIKKKHLLIADRHWGKVAFENMERLGLSLALEQKGAKPCFRGLSSLSMDHNVRNKPFL